ncbi:MAG: hypothetical protein WCR52_17760 [Bacteroidota bacterium]
MCTLTKFKVMGTFLLMIFSTPSAWGQIVYASAYDQNTGQEILFKVNLNTCEFCEVAPPSLNIGGADVVFLSDGSQLHIEGVTTNGLKRLSAPPSLALIWQTTTTQTWYGGVLAPNGLVYLAGAQGLGTFNPVNNTVTYIGNWPSNFAYVDDLFYVNGILYGSMSDLSGLPFLIQVDVNNPGQSTVIGPFFTEFAAEGGIWNGVTGVFNVDINTDISFYNPATGTNSLVCDMPANLIIVGLSFPPPGLPEYPCLVTCTTNAGALPQAGPFNTCTNSTLAFPAATGAVLDNNDILRYILFSNPNDTAGSIVATSATPSFNFAAPLQTNVTYYIAAMAGNNQNGNVNLNDPCLDFSNALQVVWKPLPSVTFSTANTNVCSGACKTINANFTGTPPFTLSYNSPAGSNTQVFSGNSGSFDVCPPANSVGNFVVQATALADAFCACP